MKNNHHALSKSVKSTNFTFDDLYIEISKNWEDRAEKLLARRWRVLKRAMKI